MLLLILSIPAIAVGLGLGFLARRFLVFRP
jgi:hypothetical protein